MLSGLTDAGSARRPDWRAALAVLSLGGTTASLSIFLWANLGHLFLQPDYTFAHVFGTRQGQTTGETEVAGAPGRVRATNIVNAGTAWSEARKQSIIVDETTAARARQAAQIQVETVRETARVKAVAECIARIRSYAASRRAECVGTGVAGGECEARGELTEQTEVTCGSLDETATPGDPK